LSSANEQSGKVPAAKPAGGMSPASDQSATREAAHTESKSAPIHGLTAKQSPDQANVRKSIITKNRSTSDINSLFQEAARLKPDDADAESRNRIGIAMIKAGIGLPAIALLREALQIKPDFAEAHNNLGYALVRVMRRENRKEAIQHFEQVLSLKPDYPEAHNNLGLALIAECMMQSQSGERSHRALPASIAVQT